MSLTDDDAGAALYVTQTNMVPGYTQTRCIEVTYTGSVMPPAAIKLYADVTSTGAPNTDNGLADDLDTTVEMGPASSKCNSGDTGFVDVATSLAPQTGTNMYATAGLDAFPKVGAPKSTGWTPAAKNEMRPFLFTVALPDASTPNDAQGDSATAAFTWSASS